jgi:hypothetical protein
MKNYVVISTQGISVTIVAAKFSYDANTNLMHFFNDDDNQVAIVKGDNILSVISETALASPPSKV